MSEKKKYQLGIAACLLMFLYVSSSEVYDRWAEVSFAWADLTERENTIRSPEELSEQHLILTSTKKLLMAQATKGAGKYDQNEAGVFDYLSGHARDHKFRYSSLEPTDTKTAGEMQDLGFKVSFATDYVTLGKWLNDIESGGIAVKITKLDVVTENVLSQKLKIDVQGRAYFFPRGSSR